MSAPQPGVPLTPDLQAIGGYRIHPACALLPMMSEAAIEELAEDIRKHGQQQPIWTWEGQILDGRNRLRACLMAGVEPDVRPWEGDDPIRWVLSLNFHRRHLTDSQKAVVGARAEAMLAERALEGAPEPEPQREPAAAEEEGEPARAAEPVKKASTRRTVATLVNVSESAIARGRKLLDKAVPELVSAVEVGAVPLSVATTVADLDTERQQSLVAEGDRAVIGEARRIRKERAAARPSVNAALKRLDEALPELTIEKGLDGNWSVVGRSPELEEDLEISRPKLREALIVACHRLDAE